MKKIIIITLTCVFILTGTVIFLWWNKQRNSSKDDYNSDYFSVNEIEKSADIYNNNEKPDSITEQERSNTPDQISQYALNTENDPEVSNFYKNISSKSYGWIPYAQPLHQTDHTNILVIGIDDAATGAWGRTDTIMIVSLTPDNKINLLSIPRDTLVNINGYGYGKINSAYTYGGAVKILETIQEILGVPINHYITINFKSAANIVDIIGGVVIDVQKNFKYQDKTSKLYIDIKKGTQLLNGIQAACYMRFRHDAYADIGRIYRQQKFIKAVLKKLKDPVMIFKIPQLIEAGFNYIDTDMDLFTISELGLKVINNDMSLNTAAVPGYPITRDASYWIMDQAKTQKLAGQLLIGRNIELILPSGIPKSKTIVMNIKKDNPPKIKKSLNTKPNDIKTFAKTKTAPVTEEKPTPEIIHDKPCPSSDQPVIEEISP